VLVIALPAVVVRAGSWLYCGVEHLPVTMIRVPRDAWSGQTQRVIPISMRGLFEPQCLIGLVCLVFLGGVMGALKYVVIGVVVVVVVVAAALVLLPTLHRVPVQYVGSPSGYEAFAPSGTISYKGQTDPVGTLILPNGTTLPNAVWNGQYANTIIKNHNQIIQLNSQFVGQTDPVNNQQYVPLQDFYVIKGQVPIQQATLNGQVYYVIETNKINPANIAGFYTYKEWIPNFVAAMNMPGTYAAGLPGNSPVFQWTNTTGTVAYQTMVYQHYIIGFAGGDVVVQSNGTIIPYGAGTPSGSALFSFSSPQQGYNLSS